MPNSYVIHNFHPVYFPNSPQAANACGFTIRYLLSREYQLDQKKHKFAHSKDRASLIAGEDTRRRLLEAVLHEALLPENGHEVAA